MRGKSRRNNRKTVPRRRQRRNKRRGKGEYYYIQDKSELNHDHLYYLYFRDKPERCLSPGNEEETKKVRYPNKVQHYNFSYSLRASTLTAPLQTLGPSLEDTTAASPSSKASV